MRRTRSSKSSVFELIITGNEENLKLKLKLKLVEEKQKKKRKKIEDDVSNKVKTGTTNGEE